MQMKRYVCTDRAGSWVAGQRKPADGVLFLADEQAEQAVKDGLLVQQDEAKQEPVTDKPKKK